MRAVVQRVDCARVLVAGEQVGHIEAGLLVYLGVAAVDGEADAEAMAHKIRYLRVFTDETGRMTRDVVERGGSVLVVSNFTLLGDARKGRRPDLAAAAAPDAAAALYERVCDRLRALDVRVETGRFREMMRVEAVNDGPINVLIDSKKAF